MDKKSKLLSRNEQKYTQPESEEKSKSFKELITYAMLSNKELKELEKKAKNNRALKGFLTGQYANSKLYYYIKGLQVLKMVANGGLRAYDTYLHTNVDKSKHAIAKQIALELGSSVMNMAFDIAHNKLWTQYETSKNTYMLEQMCNFLDDARNVVTEQKAFDGVKIRKVVSTKDIYARLGRFVKEMEAKDMATFELFNSLGSDALAFFGSITQLARESKKDALIMGGLNILSNVCRIVNTVKDNKEMDELFKEKRELGNELKRNERAYFEIKPTNKQDAESAKKMVIGAMEDVVNADSKLDSRKNKEYYRDNAIFLAMIGVSVFSEIQKCKGEIDANKLAKIMLNITTKSRFIKTGSDSIRCMSYAQEKKENYKTCLEEVLGMAEQIEEKNDNLSTPKEKVTSISFKNFKGEFYKTEIDGKSIPECIINIPSMEARSGQTVLITGNSGCGKSTILKFLRDGDIENKGQIIINDKDRVDKLGVQNVSICEAKMELSSYNALQDITKKTKYKDLSKSEKLKLKEILLDLGLMQHSSGEIDEFIGKCEYKTYEQFSTGQQKRLELAKVLFSIEDNSQVVLLDETVSNVQKELGEGAFKLIHKYTNKGIPKIVIMVSHDIETASKYADKRYHIDENQTMVEVPIRQKDFEDEGK